MKGRPSGRNGGYMNYIKHYHDNDDVDPDTYDNLFGYYYRAIYNRLEYLLNKRGYIREAIII